MDGKPDHHEYCTGGHSPNDIVVSGIAGRFPECDNVGELRDALFSKKQLLVHSDGRFEAGACEMPYSSYGIISNIDKLDADFFCVSYPSANSMDPASRKLIEVSYESIADSGYDPFDLKGMNIGVYNATIADDAHQLSLQSNTVDINMFLRCMIPNRTSYSLDFTGPSFAIDTGCSSSACAVWAAVNDINENRVEAAVITACQIDLDPRIHSAYMRHGVQSRTGNNIPFDANTDGILRTEAAVALFLQKASVARRSYGTVLSTVFVNSGHVIEGISVPSLTMQMQLYHDTLKRVNVEMDEIDFIEAHGTGTLVGDPIELNAIAGAFCTKERKKPLYLGSIKSNIGHPEASSGACGVVKALIALETGMFPPNYRFSTPNPSCQALVDGKLRVVTESMKMETPYLPVNSFGFGGTLVQMLFRQNPITYGDRAPLQKGCLPQVVLYPATTEEAITKVFDFIRNTPDLRDEFFALLHKLSFTPSSLKAFRGYALIQPDKEAVTQIKKCTPNKRPVWFVMTGMGCQWPGMGLQLMEIDVFAKSLRASAETLKQFGIDLFELLRPDSNSLMVHRSIIPAFVSNTAIQIALVDVLRFLDIHPDGIVGHSTGELVSAYADGCCTAEQTILSAYWRGKSVETANIAEGAMAAVGLTWDAAVKRCPKDVYAACENSDDSVTISGLKEPVEKFVEKLKSENIFAKVVDAYGYPFHSEYIKPAAPILRAALEKFLVDPKARSERWVTSSHPESDLENPTCKIAGAEYFVHNLMSKVRFNEATKKIPADAITIEVGPHFLLQPILKRSVGSGASYIGLMKKNEPNGMNFFLESLGKLYNEGLDPKIERLYPSVKFPVPRGTPMIADLLQWNYSQTFFVPRWTPQSGESFHDYNLDKKDSYLMDHRIDGRSLFPATGYIYLAWEALAAKLQTKMDELPVVVENFKIHRPTIISNQTSVKFYVNLLGSSGNFEVSEGNALVASGQVYEWKNVAFSEPPPSYNKEGSHISGAEVYNELKMYGYEYGPAFQGLVEINMEGTQGLVSWNNRWIPYLDHLFVFFGLLHKSDEFCLPTGVLTLKIDPSPFQEELNEIDLQAGLPVNFNANTNTCRAVGVEIAKLCMDPAARRPIDLQPTYEEYQFIPYTHIYRPEKDPSLGYGRYLYACNKVIDKISKSLGLKINDFKFTDGGTNSINISDYLEKLSPEQHLLKVLKDISDDSTFVKKERKERFDSYLKSSGSDMLSCSMLNEYPLRILTEIISENSFRKLSVTEVHNNFSVVLPSILSIVKRYSYIKFKSSAIVSCNDDKLDKEMLQEHGIQSYAADMLKTLTKDKNQDVVIGSFLGGSQAELEELVHLLKSIVKSNGFVVLFFKENVTPPEKLLYSLFNEELRFRSCEQLEKELKEKNLVTLCKLHDHFENSVYLLRSAASEPHISLTLKDNEDYSWVEEVKSFLFKNVSDTLWLVAENNPISGIVGMVNCLKQEPGGERIRCVLICDEVKKLPPFSFEQPCYKPLLEKNLLMNIWKNGTWGAFKHVSIKDIASPRNVEHSYVNCRRYGDLSSFEWLESHVKYAETTDRKLVHIYYSALNFKDVMLATGKLSIATTKTGDGGADDSVLGLEFSGRDSSGRRVAGLVKNSGMATSSLVNPLMCIDVPDAWTLEAAATVPVVYITCYYALSSRARLRRGESILIHSGSGGIGLAAINIALHLQCEIFTTVGNEAKRKYLKEKFPQIKDENIGCSRNTSFEHMIMERTGGKGVNVVLNSLADDKFQASIRCVARHGRFVEIGKYDLSLDRKIGLKIFLQNITFHGVFLDQLFENTPEAKRTLEETMVQIKEGIEHGVVKPLDRTVFARKEVEEAFRYMSKGIHVGKVLIKIREEEKVKNATPKRLILTSIPKTYFYSSKVYIVIGGLGGFGIEVTKWILNRGGKNVVLTSRYGARTPYHHLCLRRWAKAGFNVTVSTMNAAHKDQAEKLIEEASKVGPIGGIFNSAVVLKDAFMDCQNAKNFEEVCAPKAAVTKILDDLSRILCPKLDYFVCFSSVSCGRGNAGQTNYGYANSVMERICEQRRSEGLHGVAIQWGIIGDVGVVHRHMGDDAMIAGVSAQCVKSCIETLDSFCQIKSPVVSSYVNAASTKKTNQDLLMQISKVLGMKDPSEINPIRNFGEMGIDSMVGVEVKQLVENSCDVTLTMQEIFDMKLEDVKMLIEKTESKNAASEKKTALVSTTSVKLPKPLMHTEPLITLNDKSKGAPIFFIHIGDNDVSDLSTLAEVIHQPIFALLWTKDAPHSDIKAVAKYYLKLIENKTHSPFHLVGYTLGGSLALEMALQSENSNKKLKTICLLDGLTHLRRTLSKEKEMKDQEIQSLCEFVEQFSHESVPQLEDLLFKATSLEQRKETVLNFIISSSSEPVNKKDVTDAISSYLQRKKFSRSYVPSKKLTKDITIVEDPTRTLANDIMEVKELFTEVCAGKVNIHRIFSQSEMLNKEAMQRLGSTLINKP